MDFEYYITPQQYSEALSNGISYELLTRRVREWTWPIQKAITTPVRPKDLYGGWTKIAEQNGISSATFRNRVNKHGYSWERAATQPLKDNKSDIWLVIEKHRKYPKHYIELAKSNGVCYGTFQNRVKDGWSLEVAANTPVHTEFRNRRMKEMANK